MQIGIHFPNFTLPGEPESVPGILAGTAKAAEQGGCDWFTVMDHWFQMEQLCHRRTTRCSRATRTLAFVPAQTERIRLGAARHRRDLPASGRCWPRPSPRSTCSRAGGPCWASAPAWYEREHRGLGVPFPPIGRAVRAAGGDAADLPADVERRRRALRGQALPAGRDDLRAAADHGAAPADRDRRRAASGRRCGWSRSYADACNLFGTGPDVVAHKLDVLQRHCERGGP